MVSQMLNDIDKRNKKKESNERDEKSLFSGEKGERV